MVLVSIGLCLQLALPVSVQSAPAGPVETKELNFVFLHGAGGNICTFQLLSECIMEQIAAYIDDYEKDNAGTMVRVNMLQRCYPSDVDIDTWANNIDESIDEYFPDKNNLILVGHSMGGKAALYTVAQNVGGLADRVAMVITINSPVKSLNSYYVAGGGSVLQYCRARWLLSDQGVCNSVTYYDSSQDGSWVSSNKHWLAFISGEAAPLSKRYDIGGVDAWPRNMDDGLIPLSAQYSEGADVVYYGEQGHGVFDSSDEVAEFMAEQILCYLFGEEIECSVFARGGILEHEAGWLPGRDSWEDIVGGVPSSTDMLQHKNESYFKWQEWEDVAGWCPPGTSRHTYYVSIADSFLFLTNFLTGIEEIRWANPDDPEDCRLYIRTRAAPRNSVRVNWSIHRQGLLPSGAERDHYEVEILTGTPLTSITDVSWANDEPRDLRIRIGSEADRPFRWFKTEWRAYSKESRKRRVIDEIPGS